MFHKRRVIEKSPYKDHVDKRVRVDDYDLSGKVQRIE